VTAPRKKKLQIAGLVSLASGSVFALVVAVSRSYRDNAFSAGLLGKDDYAAGDGMLDVMMGLAALVFVAGCIAFVAGRFAKADRN